MVLPFQTNDIDHLGASNTSVAKQVYCKKNAKKMCEDYQRKVS